MSNKRCRWGEDCEEMMQLMLGQVRIQQRRRTTTLDLLASFSSSRNLMAAAVDVKTGVANHLNRRADTTCMPDLNSPPPLSIDEDDDQSIHARKTLINPCSLDMGFSQQPTPKATACSESPSSPQSTLSFHEDCLSLPREKSVEIDPNPSPPSPFMTVGCGKCLMYVMLSAQNARCPRCGTTSLLSFPPQPKTATLSNDIVRFSSQ